MSGKPSHINTQIYTDWYERFLDTLPVGIFRTTIEGKLIFCNNTLSAIFGFDSAESFKRIPVIQNYQNKKDRGHLIRTIEKDKNVHNYPLALRKKDGTPIWCEITARAVWDNNGSMVNIDGVMSDKTALSGKDKFIPQFDRIVNYQTDFLIILDLKGDILEINQAGIQYFGYEKTEIERKSFFDFIVPERKKSFSIFLSVILTKGSKDGMITTKHPNGDERHLEFNAVRVEKKAQPHHIRMIARDVTDRVRFHRQRLTKEKLNGVLEMAGGAAHRMNQPLTIINNLLNEVLSDTATDDTNYQKILNAYNQVIKLNKIARKIGGIKKYKSMDYVAGIKIVDIDRAS